jgi:NAD(P) transhydrogenase subunit alpha
MEQLLRFFWENRDAIFIITLSVFLGFEVIKNVPSILHTPLMSGANAISGISIIGGIILTGHADASTLNLKLILGILAVILGAINVFGGYVVTDRMLAMFKKRKKNR